MRDLLNNINQLQAEKVYNQAAYFKKTVKYVGEPMLHLESIASPLVRMWFLLVKLDLLNCI